MPFMSGAEALVSLLVRDGVDVVFGIPGVQIMDVVDAVYRDKHIRWISTRHEQTAAYMAYGYTLSTGKIGVAIVLPGPGALNTTAAIRHCLFRVRACITYFRADRKPAP